MRAIFEATYERNITNFNFKCVVFDYFFPLFLFILSLKMLRCTQKIGLWVKHHLGLGEWWVARVFHAMNWYFCIILLCHVLMYFFLDIFPWTIHSTKGQLDELMSNCVFQILNNILTVCTVCNAHSVFFNNKKISDLTFYLLVWRKTCFFIWI